jgi:hypothetical protein
MSDLTNLSQNTLAVTATFLVILRRYFSIRLTGLTSQWVYHEDPLQTRIFIEAAHNLVLEQVEKRPAIAVLRGGFSTRRATFGDKKVHEWPGLSTADIYSKEIQGTMGINVYSQKSGEAEAIANLVFELFITTEQLLEKEFKFKWLGDISIGTLGVSEEANAIFVVPLTISPVIYDMAWANTMQAPELKRLGFLGEGVLSQLKETVYKEYFPTTKEA